MLAGIGATATATAPATPAASASAALLGCSLIILQLETLKNILSSLLTVFTLLMTVVGCHVVSVRLRGIC